MNNTTELTEIVLAEITALRRIPLDNIEDAVIAIHKAVHVNGGKVIVSGMGKAGHIGHNIAMTLCSTGTPAVFLHPAEAQHGDLGVIQKNDILLLISNSGKTKELNELYYLASGEWHGAGIGLMEVIFICGQEPSFGTSTDIVIKTGNPAEACPLGLTPTTSTTVMTVIGDIIVCRLMKMISFTKEDYAKRHHGGYLGQKAKEL